MLQSLTLLLTTLLPTLTTAHMRLHNPPPFGAPNNPHLTGPPDTTLSNPYNCCGKPTPFPCKGYLSHLHTPQGSPVATWPVGSTQTFTLSGSGNHYGGSCQVGFSIDEGKSWKVVRSFEGNCPHRDGGTEAAGQGFEFRVPADLPVGESVFAWTWINREGEFNMLCAAVRITEAEGDAKGKRTGKGPRRRWVPPHAHGHRRQWRRGRKYTCENLDGDDDEDNGSYVGSATNSTSSSGYTTTSSPAAAGLEEVAFKDRPSFLWANIDEKIDNGCRTPRTDFELKYPNPGPDVMLGDGAYELKLPWPAEKCG
ncbi:hypothetical protein AJ79_06636 [Helicocarpus griseus UAMH5409]|uniref:Chitin-binding type-4 domain-containing protein n=1 Tax=Helicocarpus griseus UAMH5409 TaxID=1447875 RepID=A0A2B7XBJ4_9EURO|nr:hypothetical protein AJ79_06636 [Helicocarpus griseus UAMH5409]